MRTRAGLSAGKAWPQPALRVREQGFTEIAEGTVYALLIRVEQRGLVDVEKVPSEKGPPRKVYSLNAAGHAHLDSFWRTWGFLSDRLAQLREGRERTHHARGPCRPVRAGGGRRDAREVVGHDPVEFADAFAANFSKDNWVARERDRLRKGIDEAAGELSG